MPDPSPLRFHFDYISSNAWLAWAALQPLAARFARPIELVPVLFAGLLESTGQLGPAEVPPKMRWMARNNLRKAARLGLVLRPPAFHPFNPLLALRASSLDLPQEARVRLVDGLFRATWSEQRHVSDPAVVAAVADEAGLEGRAIVEAAGLDETKARLRRQTDDAIAAGVFGVPTLIVEHELFWGYDDLPYLEDFLAGRDPIAPETRRAWVGPQRPSAMRARHREAPPLRLARLRLPARDPEGLARWYADALGLEARGAIARGPAGTLVFEPAEGGDVARQGAGLGFEVRSREEVAGWARRFAVDPEQDERRALIRLTDPEGHAIEIAWERADDPARGGA